MKYLTGSVTIATEPLLAAAGVGLIIQPRSYSPRRLAGFPWWAADNGCLNPATYVGDDRWLRWLEVLPHPERCLFAVVPDVARRPDGTLGGDPVATWAKFIELGPLVQALGLPAALAAQDGMENMGNVAEQIDACDALFIAGSTAWKVGPAAAALARQARNAGKWVHMGRVNSRRRIRLARDLGVLSSDGTFVAAAPERRAPEVVSWVTDLAASPTLGLDPFETPSHPTHRRAAL